ncbi:signal recognition particle subunit SRP72-like [Vanacampus margaritifer]
MHLVTGCSHWKTGKGGQGFHSCRCTFNGLRPSDVGLLAVTANNIITINKDQNVFDSKKKVKLTSAEGVEYKLAKMQLQAIEFNKALLAMYTNQTHWSV